MIRQTARAPWGVWVAFVVVAATLGCAGDSAAQHSYNGNPLTELTYRVERLERYLAQRPPPGAADAASRLVALEASIADLRAAANLGRDVDRRLSQIEASLAALQITVEREARQARAALDEAQSLRSQLRTMDRRMSALETRMRNASVSLDPARRSVIDTPPPTSSLPPPVAALPPPPASAGGPAFAAPIILDHAPAAIPRPPAPLASPLAEPLAVGLAESMTAPLADSLTDPLIEPETLGRPPEDVAAHAIYDQAALMLQNGDFEGARPLLEQISRDGAYAGQALYWLGEIHLGADRTGEAAAAFAASAERYPNGEKAAESLLNLALALTRLDQQNAACAALRRARADYEQTNPNIMERVRSVAQNMGCSV